jgi:hypothetical protein
MIYSFYKTKTRIICYDAQGSRIRTSEGGDCLDRQDFEMWVDRNGKRVVSWPNADCESTCEDSRLQSWEEYYESEYILSDIQSYMTSHEVVSFVHSLANEFFRPARWEEQMELQAGNGIKL